MRITQKVSLALVIAFAALCALLWAALQLTVAPQFTEFELQKAEDNFERAHNIIDRELNQLEAYRRDYGVWDEAYEFVKGDNPGFLEEELPLTLLRELGLNIYIYLGSDSALIDGVAIDEAMENEVNIDAYSPSRFDGWRGFQASLTPMDAAQTVVATKAGLMLVAYAPVTNTDGSGAYAGHILTGRIIDAAYIAALQKQTRVEMEVTPLIGAPMKAAAIKSVVRADGFVTVAAPLRGADGEVVAMLTARTPCDITVIGQGTIRTAFIFLTVAAMIFIAIVSVLLNKLAIHPIEKLTAIIKDADAEKLAVVDNLADRKDEIGVLYSSFANLLERIDEHTRQLAGALKVAESGERAKTHFLANMSHEIRTPMNGVMGMADLLASTKLTDTQKGFVDVIVKSGDALLTIINDILDFSKLDAGMASINPAPFILADVVEDVSALVAARATSKQVELAVRIDPKLPYSFVGDAGRLRQILINLAGNAVKFTDKGYVLIDVSPVSETHEERVALKFSVIDTGVGIPEHKRAHVFEKFNQADTSSTRAHEGTGLGLAIAKALVELMGGEIGVESTPDAGSTFWFSIALEVNTKELPKTVDYEEAAGARILIIDDNGVNRRILEEQTSAWGCPSQSCDSGEEGLKILRAAVEKHEPFDLVIMDYHMPRMNGVDAVRLIRAEPSLAGTAIIMLTSVDHANATEHFKEIGVDSHLTKPARSAALQRAVARALHHTAPEQTATPENNEKPALAAPHSHDGVDVLVVEDNEVNRLVVSHILRAGGYSYEMAVNGRDAVEKFRILKPKLILMDVSMPEMNGYEATAAIREIEKDDDRRTPIIGVTAHAVKGDREDCMTSGMDDYVPKPVSPATLTAKIAEHLRAAASDAA